MASLNDLLNQKAALDKQITELQRSGRVDAINKIRSLMGEYGLSVTDVLSPAAKRQLAKGAASSVTMAAPAAPKAATPFAAKKTRKARVAKVAGAMPKAAKKTAAGSKVAAKYRDAATGQTWSGRGLKPRWLAAALASGRSMQEFAI